MEQETHFPPVSEVSGHLAAVSRWAVSLLLQPSPMPPQIALPPQRTAEVLLPVKAERVAPLLHPVSVRHRLLQVVHAAILVVYVESAELFLVLVV